MAIDEFDTSGFWDGAIEGESYQFYEGNQVSEPPPGWELVVVYTDGKAVYRRSRP